MSDKPLNIHQRISAIMKDLERVSKGGKTTGGAIYKFVTHDDVTEAVHPLLVTHGVNAIPSVISHTKDGNLTKVDIQTDFVNIDSPDDKVSVKLLLFEFLTLC